MDSILQILQGLGKSYFNVKGGSSPAIQVCTICPSCVFPALVACSLWFYAKLQYVSYSLITVACN
jgi:hypothetical protein